MSSISNKTVLVTGGTRGIGLAISKLFASKGAQVIMVYNKNKDRAHDALGMLDGQGHHVKQCDVGDPHQVATLFDGLKLSFPNLDVVVNNAGIGFHHPVDTASYEDWQAGWNAILSVNLNGPANVCYQAAQVMIPQRSGHLINVSSRGAFRGEPEQPAYGASKAGLNSLTQSLAYRLAPYNVFVGAIAPGYVHTELAYDRLQGESGRQIRAQSPMNRVATPEEVAEAVLMMSTANMWMTGGIFDVNGASYFRT